jgi:hypothetical protein
MYDEHHQHHIPSDLESVGHQSVLNDDAASTASESFMHPNANNMRPRRFSTASSIGAGVTGYGAGGLTGFRGTMDSAYESDVLAVTGALGGNAYGTGADSDSSKFIFVSITDR